MDTAMLQEPLSRGPTFSGAPFHRFTVEEYEKLITSGALTSEDRVELLDGFLIDKMPQGEAHAYSLRNLLAHFVPREQSRWITQIQSPVRVDGPWLPEPDVALLKPPEKTYRNRRPTAVDSFLFVEVAESSLATDQEAKLRAYARSGVPEYWIVNLPDQVIEVHRGPNPGVESYDVIRRFTPGEQLAPEQFPDAALSVNEILGLDN